MVRGRIGEGTRPASASAMEKLVFYGRTEAELEDRFLKWQQANGESVRNIKKHPIQFLPLAARLMLLQHQEIETLDAFSMLVEYERVH
jgi:hypothetical protein